MTLDKLFQHIYIPYPVHEAV